ncbi:MAG: glycosyltransferase family 8 protein [Desulfitobacteriaceae bacterium]|nr:glycosyltransferase family 8 protein [Desulfitobacteriaceae bacterium]
MNILVTLDSNYIKPLKTMLISLFLNNPSEIFTIFLMHSKLRDEEVERIQSYAEEYGNKVRNIKISDGTFADAPVLFHYTKEMYFRLLAYKLLPEDLDRVLYLDPDILVINPIRELYDSDFDGCFYAAAYHDIASIKEINKIRFYPYRIDAYYNSGVMLMNLELLRKEADEGEIYRFIEENRRKLVMPDQDILNAIYAKKIKSLDEKLYNYDTRYYYYYKLATNGAYNMDEVINRTVFLHFCGKKKPWQKRYSGKFHSLYKHYEKLSESKWNTVSNSRGEPVF